MNQKKRILFVDDDPDVISGLRRMLHVMRDRWDMDFVESANDAMKIMKGASYDVIVSDLHMSQVDGAELLERVRKMYPDTIRFILSGYNNQQLKEKAVRCAHQFISKPCSAEQLKCLIERTSALKEKLDAARVSQSLAKIRSLPVMPELHKQIISSLKSPVCSCRQVGRIVEHDIGMSAKLLQMANSAFYVSAGRIADVKQAVVYLGLKTVEAIVLNDGVFAKLSASKVKKFGVVGLQEHCFRVGTAAKHIAKSMNMPATVTEAAAMSGILHDVGKMVLIWQSPELLSEAIGKSRRQHIPMRMVETELFGITHAELGGYLLQLWGIPNMVIEAAAFHHEPWQYPDAQNSAVPAVYIADMLDHRFCSGIGDACAEQLNCDYLLQLGVAEMLPAWRNVCFNRQVKEYEYVA